MIKNAELLNVGPREVEYLDEQVSVYVKLRPAAFWQALPPDHLRAWAGLNARYCIPTVELIDWLRERIGGRKALEIGAGQGDLGHHLGIPMTDSYVQSLNPSVLTYYLMAGQQPTVPPGDVIREDAETAVRTRKPKVVIGAWITEKFKGDHDVGGNMYGPREEYIIERCQTYISIGNENVHGKKRIMNVPHETHYFPWLVSRAKDPSKNVIYVWEKKTTR